jgi:Ca-activated chloride channel homolog
MFIVSLSIFENKQNKFNYKMLETEYWYKIHKWLNLQQLTEFQWENPVFLYGILSIPLLWVLRWAISLRKRQKLEVVLPAKMLKFQWVSLWRFFPDVFFNLFIIFVLLALARPEKINQISEKYSEGISIVLALDISESMLEKDLAPNRLEAAKKVAQEFIEGRSNDQIGIVVFAGEAFSLAPLTTDYELLKTFLLEINDQMIQRPGTAIGNALAVGISRLKDINAKTKIIILLSDGDSNAGEINPMTMAQIAHNEFKVKIYSILVGKEKEKKDEVKKIDKQDKEPPKKSIDEGTLQKIAQVGNGKFYRANDNQVLSQIFNQISNYEKSEIKELRYVEAKDFYKIYLIWAMIFFLIWLLLKSTFMSNALED